MTDRQLHTPDGVTDFLTADFDGKKRVEQAIDEVFRAFGYRHIQSPTFEFIQVFEGKGSVTNDRMYKFTNREGNVCALRPDMTPAVARIAATRFRAAHMPLRLSYISNTFRDNEANHGKLKEVTQAGVELIGASGEMADAEVIALSVRSLLNAGLSDFRVDIGSVKFFKAVMDEMGLPPGIREDLQTYILFKDFVSAKKLIKSAQIAPWLKNLIVELPLYIGGDEVLDRARSNVSSPSALNALSELENVKATLDYYDIQPYIAYDLSMIGDLDYYTGIIWKGYASGAAYNILSGGRYDSLLQKFGNEQPAAGFALEINALVRALGGMRQACDGVKLFVFDGESPDKAIKIAEQLRSRGQNIEMSYKKADADGHITFAISKGMSGVIFLRDIGLETIDFVANKHKIERFEYLGLEIPQ